MSLIFLNRSLAFPTLLLSSISLHWSLRKAFLSLLAIMLLSHFSHVLLCVTPWTAVRQASLSITNSWSLLKLMSIEWVIPSNHLILYWSGLLFPSTGDLPNSRTEPKSPALTSTFFTTESPGKPQHIDVQFSSVVQSCLPLCNPMDCSTPGLPVHHQLPEFTQTHVHWVSDAIQPSHSLSSPSPPAFNLS